MLFMHWMKNSSRVDDFFLILILSNAWPYPVDQSPLPAPPQPPHLHSAVFPPTNFFHQKVNTLHSGAVAPTGGFPAPECGSSVGNIYWQTSAASQSLVGGSFPRPATLMISSSTLELDGELFFTAGLKDSEDQYLCLVLLW